MLVHPSEFHILLSPLPLPSSVVSTPARRQACSLHALGLHSILPSPVVNILLCPGGGRAGCGLAVLVQKALLDHQLLLTGLVDIRIPTSERRQHI